jgi:hypothetical protein
MNVRLELSYICSFTRNFEIIAILIQLCIKCIKIRWIFNIFSPCLLYQYNSWIFDRSVLRMKSFSSTLNEKRDILRLPTANISAMQQFMNNKIKCTLRRCTLRNLYTLKMQWWIKIMNLPFRLRILYFHGLFGININVV